MYIDPSSQSNSKYVLQINQDTKYFILLVMVGIGAEKGLYIELPFWYLYSCGQNFVWFADSWGVTSLLKPQILGHYSIIVYLDCS